MQFNKYTNTHTHTVYMVAKKSKSGSTPVPDAARTKEIKCGKKNEKQNKTHGAYNEENERADGQKGHNVTHLLILHAMRAYVLGRFRSVSRPYRISSTRYLSELVPLHRIYVSPCTTTTFPV